MNKITDDDKLFSTEFLNQLKIIREQREISIEEVAEKTNIKPQYIKAIEEADLAALPGGVYNKAYIRSVAEFLGVNIRQFEKVVKVANFDDSARVKVEFGRNISKMKPNKMIILICILLSFLLYNNFFHRKADIKVVDQKMHETKQSPTKTEIKNIAKKEFTISIIAVKKTDVKVRDAYSDIKKQKTLEPNEAIILSVNEDVFVDTKDIKNIEVYLNGIPVPNFDTLPVTDAGYDFSVGALYDLIKAGQEKPKTAQ